MIATVDGEAITFTDLRIGCAIEEIAAGRGWKGTCPDLAGQLDLRIERLLILHAARRLNLEPESEREGEVEAFLTRHDRELRQLRAFFGIDREELAASVRERFETERFAARGNRRAGHVTQREIRDFIAAHPKRFPPSAPPTPAQLETIREELKRRRIEKNRRRWLERLKSRARIEILDPEFRRTEGADGAP